MYFDPIVFDYESRDPKVKSKSKFAVDLIQDSSVCFDPTVSSSMDH
jgi:hypothetical protein